MDLKCQIYLYCRPFQLINKLIVNKTLILHLLQHHSNNNNQRVLTEAMKHIHESFQKNQQIVI